MVAMGIWRGNAAVLVALLACGDDDGDAKRPPGGEAGRPSQPARSEPPLATPQENGATCRTDSDCSSGDCSENAVGEFRCYGRSSPNDACEDAYDCEDGARCVPDDIGNLEATVCAPEVQECEDMGLQDDCVAAAVATCAVARFCGVEIGADLDACLENVCDVLLEQAPSALECSRAVARASSIADGALPCPED